jgi:hypothetical protein
MKQLSIFFFLMISLLQYSFSQGEFIKRGKSAVEIGGGFSTNREMHGNILFGGFSYKGFLDANLTYENANGGRIQGGVFTPSIIYYFLKQEDAKNAPTLGISLGYSHYQSKSTSFVEVPMNMQYRIDTIVTDLTVDAVKLGVSAFHRLGSWRVYFFQPMIRADISMASSGWKFSFRTGVSIGSRIKRGPLFILTPGIEGQSGVMTYFLTLGVLY